MEGARWRRLQELFHEAAQRPVGEQAAFLQSRCVDDPSLASEALELLKGDARGSALLDGDLSQLADELLEGQSEFVAKRFGAYRMLRLLGEGGMGVVYLAEREDLNRQVAIKILRDAGLSPARRALFTLEQRTLAQLTHPSITRLYDADVSPEGVPYIVMEYVDGEPLTAYCERLNLGLSERLRLFRAVSEAVQYAHEHAVIHRDLKPSNVLVRNDGSVSLLDFGIAKHIADAAAPTEQTKTILRLMTPLYAAPEQISGGIVGVNTDVYALGVMLYQLLARGPPFEVAGCTPAQVERLVAERQPERPSAKARREGLAEGLAAGSWTDLDVLCLTAMHKDPKQRYGSVEALIRDLDHYSRGEPLEARADTFWYRTRKFIGRHRVSVTAGAVTLATVIALVTAFTIRLHHARAAALLQAARAQRIQVFVTNLFQGGDAAAGPADDLRVLTLLDRGAQEAEGLGAEPEAQADLYETLGKLYQSLGRLDRAEGLLGSALRLRQAQFGADSLPVASSLTLLSLLRLAQGDLKDADSLAHQGLQMARAHAPRGDPAVAHALVAVGRVQSERGLYEEGIRTLESAVVLSSAPGGSPPDLAAGLGALAAAQYSAGHYDAARGLYKRALALDRRLHGEHHPAVADDLNSLGSIQQDLGYYREAESLAREALQITSAYYGEDHPKTAAGLTMLGRALLYENLFDAAEVTLQQALAIEEKRFGPVHAAVADTLNELGNLASARQDFALARTRFQRVAGIYRGIYGDHHYLVAIALSNAAYVMLNSKDYAAAEQAFRDVVQRFDDTLGPDNVNTGIAHIKLGRTLLREQSFEEAKRQTLAGYENLTRQANPGISYLQAARKDLAAEYAALKQPQLAARYQAEVAAVNAAGH